MAVRSLTVPNCQRIEIPENLWGIIKLYNRCENAKCLPRAGGMLDQSEKMMEYFDTIRTEFNKQAQQNIDREERLKKVKGRLRGRNG